MSAIFTMLTRARLPLVNLAWPLMVTLPSWGAFHARTSVNAFLGAKWPAPTPCVSAGGAIARRHARQRGDAAAIQLACLAQLFEATAAGGALIVEPDGSLRQLRVFRGGRISAHGHRRPK